MAEDLELCEALFDRELFPAPTFFAERVFMRRDGAAYSLREADHHRIHPSHSPHVRPATIARPAGGSVIAWFVDR